MVFGRTGWAWHGVTCMGVEEEEGGVWSDWLESKNSLLAGKGF